VIIAVVFTKITEGCLFFLGARGVKSGITPQNFTWFRYVFSTIMLHAILWIRTGKPPWKNLPRSEDLGIFLIYGCCHAYFGQYCLFIAFEYVPDVFGTVWNNMSPIFVCLIGIFLGVELITKQGHSAALKLGGTAIGVAGALTYAFLSLVWDGSGGAESGKDYNYALGNMWLFVSIFGGAVFHVYQKVVLNRGYSGLETVTWGGTLGLIIMSVIVVPQLEASTFVMTLPQWLYVLYAALLPTGLCIWVLAWVLKFTSPLFIVALNPLSTVVTAVLDLIVNGTAPTASTWISAPIILLGMYLLIWGRAREVRRGLSSDDEPVPLETLFDKCKACGQDVERASVASCGA